MKNDNLHKNKIKVLTMCKRHCSLCEQNKGLKMEVHHIIQRADDGTDDIDNLIPLCFDCHQEVGSYNPNHPKGNKYSVEELKARRNSVYEKVAKGILPVQQSNTHNPTLNDYERRLAVEKDFRDIYTFICENELRKPPTNFFITIDVLMAKYQADSFFAQSNLLNSLDNMGQIISLNTHPDWPPIQPDNPIMDEIFDLRKTFVNEYNRLFLS